MPTTLFGQVVFLIVLVALLREVDLLVRDWIDSHKHRREMAAEIQAANIRTLEGWKQPEKIPE